MPMQNFMPSELQGKQTGELMRSSRFEGYWQGSHPIDLRAISVSDISIYSQLNLYNRDDKPWENKRDPRF